MCRSSLSVRVIIKILATSSAIRGGAGVTISGSRLTMMVFVVRVMAVHAKKGLEHRDEAGDLEKEPVQPFRAEGGAMAGLLFARLRAGRIEGAVGEQRDGGAPVSP